MKLLERLEIIGLTVLVSGVMIYFAYVMVQYVQFINESIIDLLK
jgi:hypothetical protein